MCDPLWASGWRESSVWLFRIPQLDMLYWFLCSEIRCFVCAPVLLYYIAAPPASTHTTSQNGSNHAHLTLPFGACSGAWRSKHCCLHGSIWQLLIFSTIASTTLAFTYTPRPMTTLAASRYTSTYCSMTLALREIVPKWFWNRPFLCSLFLGCDLTSVSAGAWSGSST